MSIWASRSRLLAGKTLTDRKVPVSLVKLSRRSRFMARIRSLTDPYIDRMPPERMAAVVIRTTGATIASIALIAMGFIELHERHSPGAKDEPLMVSPGKTTRTAVTIGPVAPAQDTPSSRSAHPPDSEPIPTPSPAVRPLRRVQQRFWEAVLAARG